jgi:hypothetical protein
MVFDLDKFITDLRKNFLVRPAVKKIGRRFFRGRSSRLYVVVPYWYATVSSFVMRDLEKRILEAGHSCLAYQFPGKSFSDDVQMTLKNFKDIQKKAENDIKFFRKKHNFSEVVVLGISMGVVNALMIANNNPDVQKLILVVPGDSIVKVLWNGIGAIEIKERITSRGIHMEDLEKEWKELEPRNNVSGLTDKDIEIHLSRSDDVIPYKNGRELLSVMKKIGLKPKVFENKDLGHYLTIFNFISEEKF